MAVGLLMIAGGFATGVFGSLLGLGGGVLIVPLLTLGFGVPLREAVGVSLISVIVTSSASASVYLERHVANLRLGMTLELFTATGALVGGLVAFLLSERVLAGLFTALLVYTAVTMGRRREPAATTDTNGARTEDAGLRANGAAVGVESQPFAAGVMQPTPYVVRRLGAGIAGSLFAGLVSALLGVGGGIVKVPVMHVVMGVPLRVATATSNLMIGITASASAIIYLIRGGIDPYVAGPVAVGAFLGASVGSRTAHRIDARVLRLLFVAVLLFTAWQMAGRALR
jgi:uncharacterized membrane protein YfcA